MSKEVNTKLNVQFTQASILENITSGENISTSFGKMSKWFPYIKASTGKSKNMLKLVEPGYFWEYDDPDKASVKFTRNGDILSINLHSSEAGRLGVIACNTIPPPADLTPENAELYPDAMNDIHVGNATDYTLPDLDLSNMEYENMLICPYFKIGNVYLLSCPIVTVNDSILLNNKIILSGVEVTYNDNGTITLNGTANIFNSGSQYMVIPLGRPSIKSGVSYTLTGCPQGGGDETYAVDLYSRQDLDLWITDTGSGVSVIPTVSSRAIADMYIGSNVQFNNLTFSPMLCTTADYQESPDFEPWRPSLDELYDMIGDIDATLEAVL